MAILRTSRGLTVEARTINEARDFLNKDQITQSEFNQLAQLIGGATGGGGGGRRASQSAKAIAFIGTSGPVTANTVADVQNLLRSGRIPAGPQSFAIAQELYRQLAEAGDAEARTLLAEFGEEGGPFGLFEGDPTVEGTRAKLRAGQIDGAQAVEILRGMGIEAPDSIVNSWISEINAQQGDGGVPVGGTGEFNDVEAGPGEQVDLAEQQRIEQERQAALAAQQAERLAAEEAERQRVEQERQAALMASRVNEIIGLLGTGALTPDTALQFIQNRFNITPEEAQQIFNTIRGQRQRLLEEQNLRDVFLRGTAGAFGRELPSFTPAGQQALTGAFNRFQDVSPITNFFPGQEQGQAFQSFLGAPRPTREGLQGGIDRILEGFQASPQGPVGAQFQARFGTPQAAASAAIQPFLAGVAPRLRGSLAGILENQAASRFALNPEQFQTPQQIAGIFNQFRNAGF